MPGCPHGRMGLCYDCAVEQLNNMVREQSERTYRSLAFGEFSSTAESHRIEECPICRERRAERVGRQPLYTRAVCIKCLPRYCPHGIRWDRPRTCADCLGQLTRMFHA